MMQISFYVLAERYSNVPKSPDDAHTPTIETATDDTNTDSNQSSTISTTPSISPMTLDLVCRLTQTVLSKSTQPLAIVDDDKTRLHRLNTHLWRFEPTSFIAHDLLDDLSDSGVKESELTQIESTAISQQPIVLKAPVTLLPKLPKGFNGVVLNLSDTPLDLDSTALPTRVLEIIRPDEVSKKHGRDKYAHYREQGFELNYFPIK